VAVASATRIRTARAEHGLHPSAPLPLADSSVYGCKPNPAKRKLVRLQDAVGSAEAFLGGGVPDTPGLHAGVAVRHAGIAVRHAGVAVRHAGLAVRHQAYQARDAGGHVRDTTSYAFRSAVVDFWRKSTTADGKPMGRGSAGG
jgi:hypothetical protein